jgi:hypothetical protein
MTVARKKHELGGEPVPFIVRQRTCKPRSTDARAFEARIQTQKNIFRGFDSIAR